MRLGVGRASRAGAAAVGAALVLAGATGAAWAGAPQSPRVVFERVQTWTCPGLGVFEHAYFRYDDKQMWLGMGSSRDAIGVTPIAGHTRLEFTRGGVTEILEYEFDLSAEVPPKAGQGHYECDVYGYAENTEPGVDWERITGSVTVVAPDGQAAKAARAS